MSDTQNQPAMPNNLSEPSNKKKKAARYNYSDAERMRFYADFIDSKLSVEEFCTREKTPSPASMRKYIKEFSPECPDCKVHKEQIFKLEAELQGLRSSLGAQAPRI